MSSRFTSLVVAAIALCASAFAQAAKDATPSNCSVCHGKENREFEASVHSKGGVSCITCHGGVPGSLDVKTAHGDHLVSLRDPREAVESCGKCHSSVEQMRSFGLRTDQLSLYWTSKHGAKLALDGDPKVATCVSCHGAHGVISAANPLSPVNRFKQVETCGRCHADHDLMAKYGVSSDPVAQYKQSLHGKALLHEGRSAAPACTDCHGSHGAAPPRVSDIEQVCGRCHSTVQSFFDQSPHAGVGGTKGKVQCVSCHSNHDVEQPSPAMFLGDDKFHCGSCHQDAKDAAVGVGQKLHDDVEKLAATIDDAEKSVRDAGGRGLFLGAEKGYIDQARGLLVRSRAMTHTLSPAALDDILNRARGMVGQTMESLDTKDRIFRDRKIFTGIFFGIALAFAIVLLMYGREIRGNRRRRSFAASPSGSSP